ncbi:hypothetical protein DV736_g5390, partial [Chaetothyriales sp. CBS 134916]
MSIVDDQVRRLDAFLDKFQINTAYSRSSSFTDNELEAQVAAADATAKDGSTTAKLKTLVRGLSTTSSSRPVLSRRPTQGIASADDADLAWLAAGKATVQTYGLILNSLLEQTIPLSESIWYWDDVLGSYSRTALYTIQTSPQKFWRHAQEVYEDTKGKIRNRIGLQQSAHDAQTSIMNHWREFYGLVQSSIRERTLVHARTSILSPFALSRMEARRKQNNVKKLRETNATAIGLLVDEGLTFQPFDDEYKATVARLDKMQLQSTIAKSVSLLDSVLRHATAIDNSISEFEDNIFASVEADPEFISLSEAGESTTNPSRLATRLLQILDRQLPEQERGCARMSVEFGKPSRLVRYWIPTVLLLVSGTTILRILVNRRADIIQWFQDLGGTVRDFWLNWVIDPTKKLIGTIRHDEQSEIAIMSKESLTADRDSLERMVVDFAVAHPNNGIKYTEPQIDELRAKVREGDLSPVLRAYEREMQSPIRSAITGHLVQTLLIQIQKTKVDVEVAIGGIDSLLKSQELLFGFVGIAPGVLISYFVAQWLRNSFGSRKGIRSSKKKGETVRVLRNIDRTLNNSIPTPNGLLSYKDHGLLLCEVNVLRRRAALVLPGNVQREFFEDLNDLMDIRIGVARQIKVLERIRWAYSKWFR